MILISLVKNKTCGLIFKDYFYCGTKLYNNLLIQNPKYIVHTNYEELM